MTENKQAGKWVFGLFENLKGVHGAVYILVLAFSAGFIARGYYDEISNNNPECQFGTIPVRPGEIIQGLPNGATIKLLAVQQPMHADFILYADGESKEFGKPPGSVISYNTSDGVLSSVTITKAIPGPDGYVCVEI